MCFVFYVHVSEVPRPQAGASQERNTVLIVPLEPAYKAGLAGHLPVNPLQIDLKEVTLVVGRFIGEEDFFVGTKR